MSWNAYLYDDRGHLEHEANYTHNTSCMIYAVLDDAGVVLADSTRACRAYDRDTKQWTSYPNGHGTVTWWDHLDGMTGPEGAQYLDTIVNGLRADPDRFRAMNPANGWGNYDDLVDVLSRMRDSVPEWPSEWSCSG